VAPAAASDRPGAPAAGAAARDQPGDSGHAAADDARGGHHRNRGRCRLPAGVYGKTGTAPYGNGPNPPSHGWLIGYRGDVAFAVLVEGGGLGADSAGPVANAFLRNL
jgi:cell division protein FtsI/penicillin-binding protein 2